MPEQPAFTLRQASPADVPVLVSFRRRMFEELDFENAEDLDEVDRLFAEYASAGMAEGSVTGWVAESDGRPVGAGTLVWLQLPPTMRNRSGKQGLFLGLFVEPSMRRRGVARSIVESMLDHVADAGAEAVTLHASDYGRPLYEKLGFAPTSEMRYFTKHARYPKSCEEAC